MPGQHCMLSCRMQTAAPHAARQVFWEEAGTLLLGATLTMLSGAPGLASAIQWLTPHRMKRCILGEPIVVKSMVLALPSWLVGSLVANERGVDWRGRPVTLSTRPGNLFSQDAICQLRQLI